MHRFRFSVFDDVVEVDEVTIVALFARPGGVPSDFGDDASIGVGELWASDSSLWPCWVANSMMSVIDDAVDEVRVEGEVEVEVALVTVFVVVVGRHELNPAGHVPIASTNFRQSPSGFLQLPSVPNRQPSQISETVVVVLMVAVVLVGTPPRHATEPSGQVRASLSSYPTQSRVVNSIV